MANRTNLVAIYNDTKQKCLTGKYNDLQLATSVKYTTTQLQTGNIIPIFDKTVVEVHNEDTLVECQNQQQLYGSNKICALNMASTYGPGGGAERGAMAQEEELFRRSNYFLTLKDHFYRLLNGDVIYSPVVYIVKDEYYNDLKTPFFVSFVASCAIKHPNTKYDKFSKTEKYTQNDKDIMIKAIDNIFRAAYLNKKTILILGALGCGAYRNPVMEVIEIFNTCLTKYDKCFEKIVFAVYSKRDNNFDMFNEYIKRL